MMSSNKAEAVVPDTAVTNLKSGTIISDRDQYYKTESHEPPNKMSKSEKLQVSSRWSHPQNFTLQPQNQQVDSSKVNVFDYLQVKIDTAGNKQRHHTENCIEIDITNENEQEEGEGAVDLFEFKFKNINEILKKIEPNDYTSIKNEDKNETELVDPLSTSTNASCPSCPIKNELKSGKMDPDQIPYRRRSNLICPICLEEFTARRSKQNHMKEIHLVDIHCADLTSNGKNVLGNTCEFCAKKYTRTDTKKRHKRRDHFTMWVRCKFEDCKHQCWLGSELLDHLWTVHDARLSIDNYYYCVICQKNNFFNSGQLDQHLYQAHKETANFSYSLPTEIPLL